ncbi:NATT3 protein, partial [Struthidea cinerea]|nr:NATT3 protein [Struthidea cinerea]
EYVCSTRVHKCNLGAFDPQRGPFCFFPWSEREERSSEFQILVNPGGFEALDWVDASFGSTPKGAVEGCPLTDLFASKEQQALFVAVGGEEIWYKWYQILVVRQGPADVSIADVSYNGSAARERSEGAAL